MPSLGDLHMRHRPHELIDTMQCCRNHEQMSAEILDLIVAQIEERKGQDYAEAVLPPHQARCIQHPTRSLVDAVQQTTAFDKLGSRVSGSFKLINTACR